MPPLWKRWLWQPWALTWSTAVYQGSQGFAILPVLVEVGDGQVGDLVLNPPKQPLLWRLLLGIIVSFILPHGHGDGVVQDQGPDEAQDQLEVPVHDGLTVCKGNEWQRWVGTANPVGGPGHRHRHMRTHGFRGGVRKHTHGTAGHSQALASVGDSKPEGGGGLREAGWGAGACGTIKEVQG